MPTNMFGKLKPNQLMAMLQQQEGQQPNLGAAMQGGWNQGMNRPAQKSAPAATQETPGQSMQRGWFQGSDAPPPATPDLPMPNALPPMRLDLSGPSTSGEGDPRKIMFGAKEGPMHEPPPEGHESRMSTLDQYMADQFSANPAAEGPSLTGGVDISRLGAAAQEMQKTKDARRREFESTPELDKLIVQAQSDLATAKSERKKPGLGEFLTLALMNLGNKDHRNNADLVLGTGEQREKERRLESMLSNLQGNKASAQMQGRREMHSTDQQSRFRDLQMAMRKAELGQKQSNFDKDMEFKKNQAGVNLLRQLSGQDAQIEGQTMDTKTREAAAKRRAALLKTLGPIFGPGGMDPGGPETRTLEKKDARQSRLFGDFIGGGGYA